MQKILYFTAIILFVVKWESSNLQGQTPFSIGTIDTLHSSILQEKRVLNIYLPEGYSPDSAARYPVIYLLDGSRDEDFIHIAGLVQFANFSWINMLPVSIVVGIENVDRKRDFTFPTTIEEDKKKFPTTGGSAAFIRFLAEEVQPFIQQNYKVSDQKMLIGQSLGGLLATEILFKQPELFNQYCIVSPSLWWDNESLLSRTPKCLQADFQQPLRVYVAVGKEGKIMERDARSLYKLLKQANKPTMRHHFEYFKAADHGNILHLAAYKGFEFFGGK